MGIGMGRDDTGYNYNTDANGNLTRMADSDRAARYAKRAERDAKSKQMGPNLRAANDKRAQDIQERLNDGRIVSDRDKDWLKRHNNFRAQESAEDPVVARLKEIKTLLEQSLNIRQ